MFEEIERAIAEIQKPRSRFQIESFVLGQHDTQEMKYYQTCLELQDLIYKVQITQLKIKKQEIKIARLKEANDEIKELKAKELEIGLRQTRLAMIGAERELADLIDIFNSFDKKYTREEIEAAQPDYWRGRLTNNARAMLMGGSSVNYAHIEAMEQAGILDDFVLQVQEAKRELS